MCEFERRARLRVQPRSYEIEIMVCCSWMNMDRMLRAKCLICMQIIWYERRRGGKAPHAHAQIICTTAETHIQRVLLANLCGQSSGVTTSWLCFATNITYFTSIKIDSTSRFYFTFSYRNRKKLGKFDIPYSLTFNKPTMTPLHRQSEV